MGRLVRSNPFARLGILRGPGRRDGGHPAGSACARLSGERASWRPFVRVSHGSREHATRVQVPDARVRVAGRSGQDTVHGPAHAPPIGITKPNHPCLPD
jgi:hypothetical protein